MTHSTTSASTFASKEFFKNPYNYYTNLQIKSPVFWNEELNSWLVTSSSLVSEGLSNLDFSSKRSRVSLFSIEEQKQLESLKNFYASWLMFSDPPKHTFLRSTLNKALTLETISLASEKIDSAARGLVESALHKGFMDVGADYASVLSSTAICSLVGIKESDNSSIRDWAKDIVGFLGYRNPTFLQGLQAQSSARQLLDYLKKEVSNSRLSQNSLLLNLYDEFEGSRSSEQEYDLLSAVANILVDGHEPIVATLTSGLYTLNSVLDLKAIPLEELTLSVEEMLRYEPPFQYAARIALRDTYIGTQEIATGQRVMFMLGAANRDSSLFDKPNSFLLNREPLGHMSFGRGVHYCWGARIARPILNHLILNLFRLAPGFELDLSDIQWKESVGYRSLERLIIRW